MSGRLLHEGAQGSTSSGEDHSGFYGLMAGLRRSGRRSGGGGTGGIEDIIRLEREKAQLRDWEHMNRTQRELQRAQYSTVLQDQASQAHQKRAQEDFERVANYPGDATIEWRSGDQNVKVRAAGDGRNMGDVIDGEIVDEPRPTRGGERYVHPEEDVEDAEWEPINHPDEPQAPWVGPRTSIPRPRPLNERLASRKEIREGLRSGAIGQEEAEEYWDDMKGKKLGPGGWVQPGSRGWISRQMQNPQTGKIENTPEQEENLKRNREALAKGIEPVEGSRAVKATRDHAGGAYKRGEYTGEILPAPEQENEDGGKKAS